MLIPQYGNASMLSFNPLALGLDIYVKCEYFYEPKKGNLMKCTVSHAHTQQVGICRHSTGNETYQQITWNHDCNFS